MALNPVRPPVTNVGILESGVILLLTAAIFVLDVLTPLGLAVWMLYVIPLIITLHSAHLRLSSYHYMAVATVLTVVGGYLSPADIHPSIAFFNRTLSLFVMWTFTWTLVRQKQSSAQLMEAEAARSQAETGREAAVAARDLAEAGALGAIHRETEATRELLTSRLRMESILHSAMDAIITVDDAQRILLFNESAERMFQCPAREAIGQTLDKFIPARFHDAHRHHVQTFGESGVTSRRMGELGAVMGLRGSGEEFPVEAAISHISVHGKKFYTVILRDVTERKRGERLLRQSEERYRRLISVSPLAIIVMRGERVIFVNDAGIKLFGAVKADEILGKSALELFHPHSHALMGERLNEVMVDAEVPIAEEKIITMDGRTLEVEVSSGKFVDEEGPALVKMMRDVGERKRLQEQLRRTERIAELGTVASGMAHEIGTPMNVILGRAEYLMERVKDEPIKKGLQTIVAQVERITKVVSQLLSFARRRTPNRRALDLKDVIENSVEIFHERLARNQIQVELALEPCPPVHADVDQMSQVLINLIMNAVHAMPAGGLLRISVLPAGDMVKLTVADTGHGIPPDVVGQVFDPFFTTKEFGKGTGLGLTVVKGILEEHGGSIAVQSEQGKGTAFTILLPVHWDSSARPAPSRS
jgi:PAS domain S-box-containing protein